MSLSFLNPTNRPVTTSSWAPRHRTDLAGATVGVIWNGRPNGDYVLKEILSRLADRSGVRLVDFAKKPLIGNLAPQQIFENLISEQVEFVLAGVGD